MSTSTKVEILLFAGAREQAGKDRIDLHVDLPCTVGELRTALVHSHSDLGPFVGQSRIAVEREFVNDDFCLTEKTIRSSIALIPPVSGG